MQFVATRAGMTVMPPGLAEDGLAKLTSEHRFVAPLVAAGGGAGLDVIWLTEPEARWPGRHLRLSTTPTLIVVGDDPGLAGGAGGPDAWGCGYKLGEWARFVIIHAAGGEASHYQMAVDAAYDVGAVCLIETTTRHAKAWDEQIDCRRLVIWPRDDVHPIPAVLH